MAKCEGNLKTCSECGYRYKKEDAKWQDGGACPECGANRHCKRDANNGMAVCQVHGGGSYKKGRAGGRPNTHVDIFKPALPHQMMDTYEAALDDARLYQLRRDIAVLEARQHDLLKRIDTGDSGKFRADLKHYQKQFIEAQRLGNAEEMKEWLGKLFRLISEGYSDYVAWGEYENTATRKSNLISKEFKHMETTQKMVAVEQVMEWANAVAGIVNKRVEDERVKELIQGDFYELMNVGSEQAPVYEMNADSE